MNCITVCSVLLPKSVYSRRVFVGNFGTLRYRNLLSGLLNGCPSAAAGAAFGYKSVSYTGTTEVAARREQPALDSGTESVRSRLQLLPQQRVHADALSWRQEAVAGAGTGLR